ncbi:Hsp70 family protein [Mycolicibacterium houstonense]|uniref:Hsp70 family protein n=1 Tax=Mycolicibacterium houstonense TaxID=146021 RepID=UPI00082F7944|nr:Hsp70 family protein [Mycolicibacterium houstonense]
MADGIGLSIGSTNLTAVVVGRAAVTRSPVLTLFPHRAPEVGVPSENPNLNERGLILTDFVDRVGDPVGMLAPDGSTHRGEEVVADALGALLHTLTGGRPPIDPIAVTYPAHWRPNQVEALRNALAGIPDFGDPVLTPDAVAALVALQDNPGVPTRGVIAVCDFGGSGTSITLADAGNGYQPIAPTIRHPDLSGDLIDQGLLTHVVNDLSAAGTIDLASTSAIGSLGRLRSECRRAKERLSTESVTTLVAELPGHRSDVRLNRNELDDVITEPLREFTAVLQDAVERSGLRPGDLVAVASTGGGARIPAITTTLSEHFRVPVITAAQPELTPTIGGGLIAVRGTAEEGMTAMAPASAGSFSGAPPTAAAALVAPEPPPASQALAWSDAQDVPDVAPAEDYRAEGYGDEYGADFDTGFEPAGSRTAARPRLEFGERELTDHDEIAARPWYRRPPVILGAGAAAVLVAVVAALVTVTGSDEPTRPASTTRAVTSTSPTRDEPAPAVPVDEPAPQQVVTEDAPAPQTVTQTVQQPAPQAPPADNPPPAETPTPAPTPTTTEAPPPTTTQAPTTTQPPATTQAPWSPTAPYPTIPGLPWVPAPGGGQTGG